MTVARLGMVGCLLCIGWVTAAHCREKVDLTPEFICTARVSPAERLTSLIGKRVVRAEPYVVSDSFSFFSVNPGYTIFGLDIVAAQGYEHDKKLFDRGPGTPPPVHYGFIVRGTLNELSAALDQRGIEYSKNEYSIDQRSINIFSPTKKRPADPLPPGVNLRLDYATIVCGNFE